MPYFLNRCALEVFLALYRSYHFLVEVAKEMVVELLIVNEVPLASCILVAPSVALSWEIDPLGMSKLVAHEVEVASVYGRGRGKAYHLVQGYSSVHVAVLVSLT